ncbi:translesion DNA synthesis-associated protein ImuA [Cellvibrio mixtus]|uniref:translesion DNA synthesis-associated protein ImuA n=1 Tax=Cellvibrio mixtus TaxID=39650 RepID=UPI000587F845|nr:translesion DNA synthesis-associated protein ImuA [Cellvibrio mixtus]
MNQQLPTNLEQLLQRGDIWRGTKAFFQDNNGQDTGHPELNNCLVHHGWPRACLIEINQQELGQGEWLLLAPALRNNTEGLQILINPPALPFAQGFLQAGLNLDQILIVNAPAKNDFLAAFVEIARAKACSHLLAWQPQQALNYTEIRKCVLASNEGSGIYWLLRHSRTTPQSSPAHLRLRTQIYAEYLEVLITKQKGGEQSLLNKPLELSLPREWMGYLPHADLDNYPDNIPHIHPQKPVRSSGKITNNISRLRSR